MPKQHRPGPRFELSDGALTFIAERDPRFQRNANGDPNVARIAAVGGSVTQSTLSKIVRGELPLSLEALAGMVKASGARTDKQVWAAVQRLLVYVPGDEKREAETEAAAA